MPLMSQKNRRGVIAARPNCPFCPKMIGYLGQIGGNRGLAVDFEASAKNLSKKTIRHPELVEGSASGDLPY